MCSLLQCARFHTVLNIWTFKPLKPAIKTHKMFTSHLLWSSLRLSVLPLCSCLQVRSEFSLKTHAKLETMVKGINEIIPLAQGTMTGLAIKYVMNNAFTAEAGDRPKVTSDSLTVLICWVYFESLITSNHSRKSVFFLWKLDAQKTSDCDLPAVKRSLCKVPSTPPSSPFRLSSDPEVFSRPGPQRGRDRDRRTSSGPRGGGGGWGPRERHRDLRRGCGQSRHDITEGHGVPALRRPRLPGGVLRSHSPVWTAVPG